MSEFLHYFESSRRLTAVLLPFRLEDMIREWSGLRSVMARTCPKSFTREEWGYLLHFLSEENLIRPFEQSFGRRVKKSKRPVTALLRPRGPVAIWLPNNVSLLGPLTAILMSLGGNALCIKTGSHSHDLTVPFLDFCRARLKKGVLADYLTRQVAADHFDHEDPRNSRMSQEAQLRIAFGSDQAVLAVHALPHPLHSTGVSFSDRQSQAWVEPKALTEAMLVDLIKVFAVYGQAGCTSPQKVILLGGDRRKALALRDALVKVWPKVIRRDPPLDAASENLMVYQWATMMGWEAALAPRQGAVFAVGHFSSPPFQGRMALPIIPATLEEARLRLPPTIQTLGYAVSNPRNSRWLKLLGTTVVKRFVPIARMHHFGPVWDGWDFWREGFENVEVSVGSR